MDQFLSTPFSKLLKLINIQIYPGKGRLFHPIIIHCANLPCLPFTGYKANAGLTAYILGKTILICVKNNSCFNTEAVYICRSIKAVGGAVVMVSAATLHQIVTPELSSVHHPPMSWSLAADDNSPGPRVTSGAWMIIILAIDLQISPQTIRSLQNNFLSELF